MAPIKFEEHIREKLENREIQPSAQSWDKLNSRLERSEKRTGTKWWISAAAAVVVLLIASVWFVNQQEQISTPIVESPVEEVQKPSDKTEFEQPVQVASENEVDEKMEKSAINQGRTKEAENDNALVENNNQERVQENIQVQPKREVLEPIIIDSPIIAESKSDQIYSKVQEVLASISQAERKAEDFTEAEVDALLAEAARDIANSEIINSTGGVSADALLADAEFEVDQSFRKEVFDFLKEEFLKAKTAVATRND